MTGAEDKGPKEPSLVVKGGPTDGFVFPLQPGTSILVGSGRLAHLSVEGDEIGSAHIKVTWDDNGISVTDNGSIGGTFVNGEQVETALLLDGDHIAFAAPGEKKHLPKLLVRIPPGFVQAPPPPAPEVLTAPAPPERPFVPRRTPVRGGPARKTERGFPRLSLPRLSLPSLSLPSFGDLSPVLIGSVAGGAVLLIALIVLLQRFFFSTPVVTAIQPDKAEPGQTVTLSGKRFAEDPAKNTVWFGDKSVPATASTGATLAAVVPEAPPAGGQVSVSVETPRGRSQAIAFVIHTPLRVTGFEPEAAMPGEEVTAKGQGFAEAAATVTVAGKEAQVVEARRDGLRFKVPEVPGEAGIVVPVVVRVGGEAAKPAALLLGRLPVVLELSPQRANPGDRVTIRGGGFSADPAGNAVTVGGVPALVLSASPRELQVLAPAAGGDRIVTEAAVVVHAGGKASTNRAVVSIARQATGSFVLRFFPAAVSDAGVAQAFVATDVGPVLLLSSPAGAPSVAERAISVSAALNAAFDQARGGQAVVFEARQQPSPGVGVRGATDLIVPATAEDASGYATPLQGMPARASAPSASLLVDYWAALLNDYLSIFVANEKPLGVLTLSPRGRTLVELRSALNWRPGLSIAGERVAALGPDLLNRLRETALLVPEQGQGLAAAAIEGVWEGEMQESGGGAKSITVRLRAEGSRLQGTLTNRSQAIAMDVALKEVSFQKGVLNFVLPVGAAARTFVGTMDGTSISGTIHSSPNGPAVGRFSLRNVP